MSATDDRRPPSTPVPPRGGKRKPNRPAARPGRPGPAARPAPQRRASVAQARRRRQTLVAAGAIAVVVVVVVVLVIVKVSGNKSTLASTATAKSGAAATANPPVSAADTASYTAVPTATLAAAAAHFRAPSAAWPQVTSYPALATGKPEILYLGAEYCPYCATERWPLVLALSKFGTFSSLHSTESSSKDVDPNTPTWTFYGSTYTSPYLTFTPVEEEDRAEHALQTPTAAENAVAAKYDSGGSIPFVDFNGKAILSGAEYDPSLLAGKTFAQALADVEAGTSTLASSVYSNAGALISDICRATDGQPGSVCKLFPKPITG